MTRFHISLSIPGSPKTDGVFAAALDHLEARLPLAVADAVLLIKAEFENDHIQPGSEQWKVTCEGPASAATAF